MKWHRGDRYYIKSDCGRFTVSRASVLGEWVYSAWNWRVRPPAHLHSGDKHACIRACKNAANDGATETTHERH